MKTISKIFSLAILLVALLGFNQAQAQQVTINNNSDCAVEVNILGHDGCTLCGASAPVIVAAGASTTYTVTGNGCTITDATVAKVKAAYCTSTTATARCAACGFSANNSSFTIDAGCCVAVNTTYNVDVTCSGSDITVDVY